MDRRNFMKASTILLAAATTRCSDPAQGALVDTQILADIQGLVNQSRVIIAQIKMISPGAITADDQAKIDTALAAALAGAQMLTASTPIGVGADTLTKVTNALNTIMAIIGAVLPAAAAAFPALAPVIPIYDAAIALMPGIIAYVAQIAQQINPPAPTPAPAGLHIIRHPFTPAQARAVLGIS